MILHSFFILLVCGNSLGFFKYLEVVGDVWENPHDFFLKGKSYVIGHDGTEINVNNDRVPPKTNTELNFGSPNDACPSFLFRFINIILQNTGLKNYYMKPGEDVKTVTVDISVTKKTLETLQTFNSGGKISYHDLDECFGSFFEVSRTNFKCNEPEDASYLQSFVTMFSSLELNQILIWGISFVLLLLTFLILRKGIRYDSAIAIIFILYYSLRVYQSLWNQYEDIYAQRIISLEENLDKHGHIKIPDECYPARMSALNRIYYKVLFTSDDPCLRYLKAKKSILSELDIEQAVTQPIYGLIFSALSAFGDSAGKATSSFAGHFPGLLQLLLPPIVIYCFFSSIFNYGFGGLTSLFSFRRFSRLISYPSVKSGAQPQGLPSTESPKPNVPTVVNNFNFSHPPNFPSLPFPGTSSSNTQMVSANGFKTQISECNYENVLHVVKRNGLRKRKNIKASFIK